MPQAQSPTIHRNGFIALFTAPDTREVYREEPPSRKTKKRRCSLLSKQWRSPLSSVTVLLSQRH